MAETVDGIIKIGVIVLVTLIDEARILAMGGAAAKAVGGATNSRSTRFDAPSILRSISSAKKLAGLEMKSSSKPNEDVSQFTFTSTPLSIYWGEVETHRSLKLNLANLVGYQFGRDITENYDNGYQTLNITL
uniref:Uncharacterized protein n=1 Tax=Romanomermis culicivorax TaxID=13658 RepID=A0A915KHU7_ROMCU